MDYENVAKRVGNYFKPMMKIANSVPQGKIVHCIWHHDDWCGYFKRKPCNCNPTHTLKVEE